MSSILVDRRWMTAAEFQGAAGLTVGGWLWLSDTPITALPEGLTVGGSLYLRDTQITSLPEGLTVGGWLCLSDTQIAALMPHLLRLGIFRVRINGLAYEVAFDGDFMTCGCERHTLAAWDAFDDRRILEMDGKAALKFWREHKTMLLKTAHALAAIHAQKVAA